LVVGRSIIRCAASNILICKHYDFFRHIPYCLATIEAKRGRVQEAIKILDQAVSEQAAGYKAFLSLRLLGLLPSGQRRQELIAGLAGSVIELGSMGAEQRLDDSFRQIALPSLVVLRLENRQNDFTKLLEYLEQSGECSSAERYKTFESLYAVCAQQSTSDAAAFLRDIVADFGANPAAQQSVLSAVTTLIVRDKDFSYSHRYIDLIKGRNPDLPLDEADYIEVVPLPDTAG
jgi:hypothetical protein